MTLRVRLLIGILILTAVGLLVVDVVSYRALEGHLDDRADQQVESATRPLEVALRTQSGSIDPQFGAPRLPGESDQEDGEVAGESEEPPGNTPGGNELPPGTFGQLRSSSGQILNSVSFDYEEDSSRPDLTGEIPVTDFDDPAQPVTVSARQGEGDFRVVAVRGPDGLITYAAIPLSDNDETLEQLALIQAIVTISVLAAIAGLAWWVIGIGLRPLRKMSDTADEIARGDLSRRVEDTDPKTEVGRLGISLNSMLGQIEESFRKRQESEDRMRRFLADASHELRTPLASIRGYSELYRLGAIEQQGGIESAMGRIESESKRMGDLVDDLLALARLDEMPEPVKELVLLGPILEESVADLRVTVPDREVSFEAGGDLRVEGDADQLRRAIGNVLRNASIHTPVGTPVEVTAVREENEVTVTVRDHGAGLPPGTEEKVFDRFWRDSESRSRDGGGAGIGLAIVSAILDAHDGSVEARNADDGGAIFTLRLPAAP